jgi:hypothetical protein
MHVSHETCIPALVTTTITTTTVTGAGTEIGHFKMLRVTTNRFEANKLRVILAKFEFP